MEYKGVVERGLIRPFDPIALPDGTEVTFRKAANGPATRSRSAPASLPSADPFWRGYSIDQLTDEQNVIPAASLDDLAGEWPEEDDIEEFLHSIREWRR